jgi:hypothetical protein
MSRERQGLEVLRRDRMWWAVLVSIAVHVVGIGVVERLQPTSEEVAQRVMFVTPTVGGKFVMRTPRVTKRLELRKIPRERGARAERGQAPVAREEGVVARAAVAQAEAVVERVVRGAGGVGGRGSRVVGVGEVLAGAGGWSQVGEVGMRLREVGVTKEPERRVDMSLEMLDVNSLDMGRYQAMVIRDPRDKQALKGFIHIARVFSRASITSGAYGTLGEAGIARNLQLLVQQINEYTGLRSDFISHIGFDDERLMEVPIVFWAGGTLTESEISNLARYLKAGGFIFGALDFTEGLEKYAAMIRGQDFYIERLPENHPLFTSFFDIKDQPSTFTASQAASGKAGLPSWNRVEGLWVQGRLCAVATTFTGWGQLLETVQRGSDGTRSAQFLLNAVVYALTQERSITQQLMQVVK